MSRRRSRNRVSTTPVTATIEQLSHDGRGIARINGKATFIQGALPEETVTFQYLNQKRDYDEGKLVSVIEPSKLRAEPHCQHYAFCGGCSLQHLEHASQVHEKQRLLLDLLARIGKATPETILEPLVSDDKHYRNKARLSVRFVAKKHSTLIGFRERNNPRFITEIDHCPVLNAKVDAEILHLRQLLDSLDDATNIAQIEVAAGDEDVALIFRHLSMLTEDDKTKLRQFSDDTHFQIFLQPAGPDSVHLFYPETKSAFLTYDLPESDVRFSFYPTDFTQVNARLNRLMVQRALTLLNLTPNDRVLDLFCGLGNFSLPIARQCAHVTGIEGSEDMVKRAQMNAQQNDINNAEFYCANLDDEDALTSYRHKQFTKLLLDPPRSGAQALVKKMHLINPKTIVYVSCNPATLARDCEILVHQQGYRLCGAGVMDMFPHTSHVESIAVFERS